MPVTLTVVLLYLALCVPLITIHETIPPAPNDPTMYRGLNLTEAWLDLQELSNGYHPYNSRRNDDVRNWLLRRITEILDDNQVVYHTDSATSIDGGLPSNANESESILPYPPSPNKGKYWPPRPERSAVVFNDLVSNFTSNALTSIGVSGRRAGISTYFEGSNIIVYIRGTEDEEGEWWKPPPPFTKGLHGKGGVMVNAHFDSVSTGYGATDDGVGVITALQLIKYFTTEGNTPERGVIALFNNGEEDGLYGAKAFLSHPMSSFVHTFLNLEGAGAGGRATLFRSTDAEVTQAYSNSPYPFGTVVSADGFQLGVVRSETDYIVFRAEGYRGLDVAFWEPRARYHTDEDDAKHTSKASLWHMLSAAVETTKALTSNTDLFVGPRKDGDTTKVQNGVGNDGVWFDMFGMIMPVFKLRSLFALSLAVLITAPLTLVFVSWALYRSERYYLFSSFEKVHRGEDTHDYTDLACWKGAWRYPIVFIVSAALTLGAALSLSTLNPLIIYSSQHSVWAMSISLFFCIFWLLMNIWDKFRPSALHKTYSFIWLFSIGWILLVAATVVEDRFKISAGYLFVVYESAIFIATLIALCEFCSLPPKPWAAEQLHDPHGVEPAGVEVIASSNTIITQGARPRSRSHRRKKGWFDRNWARDGSTDEENERASERTPLITNVGIGGAASIGTPSGFSAGYHNHGQRDGADDGPSNLDGAGAVIPDTDGPGDRRATDCGVLGTTRHRNRWSYLFGCEQHWAKYLPKWTWLLQFLVLAPLVIIIVGPVGLLLVSALSQTGTDGSSLLLPYLTVALFSVLLVLPISPFMHKISYTIPAFLCLAFLGTTIYNMTAFPFSQNNRYKAYFQQTVDLETGTNHVTLVGIEQYIREIISHISSAAGQNVSCVSRPEIRSGLSFCSWEGLAPRVVRSVDDGVPPERSYNDWLDYKVTRIQGHNSARFQISGKETKACILRFDEPFSAFNVHGAANNDGRWAEVPSSGSDQIKLWHRDWDRHWDVDVAWPVSDDKVVGEEGRSGRIVCLWSDHNEIGTIPALDEVQRFAPKWTSIVKVMDGLVEGSKPFNV